MQNNYDTIAFCYDHLSRLVFGKAQINAQSVLLPYIRNGARILIVGGGTGWILEEIYKIHPSGLDIVYIDRSAKMLLRSKKRNCGLNNVLFIQKGIEEIRLKNDFDVIITGFFFDNFNQQKAEFILNQLNSCLRSGGRWFFTDFKFNPGKRYLWQHIMLKIMYFFFRAVCKIEATHLTDILPLFSKDNYRLIFKLSVYGNFIHSFVYEKPVSYSELPVVSLPAVS
jgi:ubiquinone/menaquinone biosynthesis C-methylase UbiE